MKGASKIAAPYHRLAGPSQFAPESIDRIVNAVGSTGRIHPVDSVGVVLVAENGSRKRRHVDARAALSERLWAAAYDYMLARSNERRRIPSMKAKYFDKIENAAEKLIAALQIGEPPRFPGEDWINVGVPELPSSDFDMLVAATWIRDAARAGRLEVAGRVGAHSPHPGDVPIQHLIANLALIYRDVFGRAIGATNDAYGSRGPLHRFCKACMLEINKLLLLGVWSVNLTEGKLAAYIRRAVTAAKS